MAFQSKILAQSNPGPSLTDVYTVPSNTSASLSIFVCNQGVFADTIRVAVAIQGEANHPKQYLEYNRVLEANSSYTLNGIYLRAGDVLRVWASVTDISFNVMGTESN